MVANGENIFGPPFLICGPGTCSCRALLILRNPSEDSLTRIEVPSSGAFDELTDLVKPEVRVDCECNCPEHFRPPYLIVAPVLCSYSEIPQESPQLKLDSKAIAQNNFGPPCLICGPGTYSRLSSAPNSGIPRQSGSSENK